MKNIVLTLSLLVLAGLAVVAATPKNALQHDGNESPLSFAVVSDLHHGNSVGEGPQVKVPLALKNITSYKPLDAIFAVGDITDGGTAKQYTQFRDVWGNPANFTNPVGKMVFMMGNHDNRGESQVSYQSGLSDYNGGEAYPLDQYMVIKGYPFITISQRNGQNNDYNNAANGEEAYPAAVREQLRQWLAQAAQDCPGKPIFVFTHVAPRYTCYSSWPGIEGTPWSMNVLNPILNEYPQAVVFSGHSHYPIGDPRSIHQGVDPQSARQNYYTVINTGSLTYSEVHSGAVSEGIHPAGYAKVTEGMILTEQPNGDIEIRRYDTYRNEEIDAEHRWVLKAPFDGSMFEYADKRDADDNPLGATLRDGLPAPVFADEAVLEVVPTDVQATITFPQATDENCVFRYKVRVLKEGVAVKEKYVFSQFYLNSQMPDKLSVDLDGLTPQTNYTFEVTAYDSYDNASEPISKEATTSEIILAPTATATWTFDNADDMFACSGNLTLQPATESLGVIKTYDDPSEIGIVSSDGPNSVNKAITVPKGSYLKLTNGSSVDVASYTLMYDLKPKVLSGYQSLLQTNVQNRNDGDFFIKNNTIGYNASGLGYGGSLVLGQWHRIVFVVNEGFVTTYIDGVKIGASTSAKDSWIMSPGFALLFADESNEEGEMNLAEFRYWDTALTAGQVASLGEINLCEPSDYEMGADRISPSDLKDGDLVTFEAASTTANYGYFVKEADGIYKWAKGFENSAVWQVIATGHKSTRYTSHDTYYIKNVATGNYAKSGKAGMQTSPELSDATEFVFFDRNTAPYSYGDYNDQTKYPKGWDDRSWTVYDIVDFWWRNDVGNKATGSFSASGTHNYMWNVRKATQKLTATTEGSKMTLHGDVTPEAFGALLENTDVTDVLSVDLTTAKSVAGITLAEMQSQFSDNTLFVATAATGISGSNLIVDGVCDNLIITDGKPFAAPNDFTAGRATYERQMPSGSAWGTICLPCTVSSNDKVTYYTQGTVADGVLTLVVAETVPAGTPAIFHTTGAKLSTISTGDVKANANDAVSEITLMGTYSPLVVTDENAYYIKSNKFWRRSNDVGGYFTVAPFRAYFTTESSKSPSFNIAVNDDDVTSVASFLDKSATIVGYYDLGGNRYSSPRRGINIIEYNTGEKQIINIK